MNDLIRTRCLVEYPLYTIYEDGRILEPGGIGKGPVFLKPGKVGAGYSHVRVIQATGIPVLRYVHRLVCEAFNGPAPEGKPTVRHLDGNPANNHISNLAWGSWQEQIEDKKRHGTWLEGVQAPWSKLSEQEVQEIRDLCRYKAFPQRVVAALYGVSQQQISKIHRKQNHKNP